MPLPHRSPRLPTAMLMDFDVSCGESLLPGHVVVVRGLADQGWSNDDLTSRDQTANEACQMIELVYEIVPGVTPAELPSTSGQSFTVDATYGADVPLHWSTGGNEPGGAGGPTWVEEYRGGESTVGGLGPWPVPSSARYLSFWLQSAGVGLYAGELRVDLQGQTALWVPA